MLKQLTLGPRTILWESSRSWLYPAVSLQPRSRWLGTDAKKPRLRFAPSPTGLLHLGGLRTALYNYLMCRKTGGTFVLRIEDTDRARLLPGAVENIQDSLEWMGLTPDEGPRYGGPFAPYVQSERLAMYKELSEALVKRGAAYRCYCSPLRLEVMRKEAVKCGEIPRYDNRCRALSAGQDAEKRNNNESFVVRLKMDPRTYDLNDEVFGTVSLRVDQEGDPVMMKSDGFPTYHLANVADDHAMQITHVLRGIEWQVSTPKHLRIYEAMGWTPPVFAHLPLLLNADGTKLSKRKGAQEIMEYKTLGMYPEAVINLLAQAGGGFTSGVANTSRLYPLEELIEEFDISLVNRNSCQLNFSKLADYNRQALAHRLHFPLGKEEFVSEVRSRVMEKYQIQAFEPVIRQVVDWAASTRLTTIKDLFSSDLDFIWLRRESPEPIPAASLPLVRSLVDALAAMQVQNFTRIEIAKKLRASVDEAGSDFKNSMHLLRLALCGLTKGPSVAEMAEILGQPECLSRLRHAVGIAERFCDVQTSKLNEERNKKFS